MGNQRNRQHLCDHSSSREDKLLARSIPRSDSKSLWGKEYSCTALRWAGKFQLDTGYDMRNPKGSMSLQDTRSQLLRQSHLHSSNRVDSRLKVLQGP